MISNRFKKRRIIPNKKPSYLRYDDVFMSSNKQPSSRNVFSREDVDERYDYQQSYNDNNPYDDDIATYDDEYEDRKEYFSPSNNNNIIDERMVKYKKRQLPPLQRYGSNNPRDMYEEYRISSGHYDDEYARDYRRNSQYDRDSASLRFIWKKFLITFGGILLLVVVSWIAYNCGGRSVKNDGHPVIIEPDESAFKVLPDNPGGIEVPHQDKNVYTKINKNNGMSVLDDQDQEGSILPSQEDPDISSSNILIDEYSFVYEKTYYIKVASNKNKTVLLNEINSIKNKYANKINGESVFFSVKSVRDRNGEQKYAILIGPFESKNTAITNAQNLGTNCSIIAVRE